ncbi:MAG: EscN/YscN/HrcN family type III secretion system ATPase [Enterobacteriaceae bacterium]
MKLPDLETITSAVENKLFVQGDNVPIARYFGHISRVEPSLIHAILPGASQGELCLISGHLQAEVIAVTGENAVLSPFDKTTGLRSGEVVERLGYGHQIKLGESLLGKVLDGLGVPMDGSVTRVEEIRANNWDAPPPLERSLIDTVMPMGVRAIDSVIACGIGQRIGIFAAAGVGKSVLLGMLAGYCEADIVVIALVGERGREVKEFLEYNMTERARARSVVVVATSDRPPLERMNAMLTATTIAEYFRDQGKNVLLMSDSLTRFARSYREIALAAGEPAVSNGYPPSVFVNLARLVERAGPAAKGSITAIYTILVEGDNMNEPIADEVRSLLDGHIVLSRELAEANHYPAIDINASVSRLMNQIVTEHQWLLANRLRRLVALYKEVQLLIRVGEYQKGQDPDTDEAVARHQVIEAFLTQRIQENSAYEQTLQQLGQLLGR